MPDTTHPGRIPLNLWLIDDADCSGGGQGATRAVETFSPPRGVAVALDPECVDVLAATTATERSAVVDTGPCHRRSGLDAYGAACTQDRFGARASLGDPVRPVTAKAAVLVAAIADVPPTLAALLTFFVARSSARVATLERPAFVDHSLENLHAAVTRVEGVVARVDVGVTDLGERVARLEGSVEAHTAAS